MRAGSVDDSFAQRRTTARVLHLLCSRDRSECRMPQTTGRTPARREASPPSKSAWYIQVWTSAGLTT